MYRQFSFELFALLCRLTPGSPGGGSATGTNSVYLFLKLCMKGTSIYFGVPQLDEYLCHFFLVLVCFHFRGYLKGEVRGVPHH